MLANYVLSCDSQSNHYITVYYTNYQRVFAKYARRTRDGSAATTLITHESPELDELVWCKPLSGLKFVLDGDWAEQNVT